MATVNFEPGSATQNGYDMAMWVRVGYYFVICGEDVYFTYSLRPQSRGYNGDNYFYNGKLYSVGAPIYESRVKFWALVSHRGRQITVDDKYATIDEKVGTCEATQRRRLASLRDLYGEKWTEQDAWAAVNMGWVNVVGKTRPLRNYELELQIAAKLGMDLEAEKARQEQEMAAEGAAAARARREAEKTAAEDAERARAEQEAIALRDKEAREAKEKGRLAGRIVIAQKRDGIGGAAISISRGAEKVATTSSADGTYRSPLLAPGKYSISVKAEGYQPAVLHEAEVTLGQTADVETIPLVPASARRGIISGVVRNARNAQAMGGVTVQLRTGVGSRSGAAVSSIKTTATGKYRFTGLAAGTYSITAATPKYVNGTVTGISVGGTEVANQDVLLSPVGTDGEIRIVLSWGAAPQDLDSHLVGPGGSGRFHLLYSKRGSLDGDPFAGLDVDDTDSFGPETITVARQQQGVYRYAVQHFNGSGSLSTSGAAVQVYRGSKLLGRFEPPPSASAVGDVWTVFELNGSSLTPINTIGRDLPN
jgi:hypothetical protein